jgi:cytochrome P450
VFQGEEWKTLRKRFNPGFAPQHLMTLLPKIVKMSRRFINTLDRFAESGEEFRLDEPCINLTFDIIGEDI